MTWKIKVFTLLVFHKQGVTILGLRGIYICDEDDET